MSFRNPFKSHVPKKSAISETTRREFEREEKRLADLEENSKKIVKDVRRYSESLNAQTRYENRLMTDFLSSSLVKEDANECSTFTDSWQKTVQQQEQATSQLNATSQKAVIDPVKKWLCIFPAVQNAVRKREQSLQELTRCIAKVEKYQDRDRTGPNIVKFDQNKKSSQAAKEEFESLNNQLMKELPAFLDGRVPYIEPCLYTLLSKQIQYLQEAETNYQQLSYHLEKCGGVCGLSTEEQLDQIKALSIASDN